MMATLSLPELKVYLQSHIKKELLSFSKLESGIPKGGITAISGSGKTKLALQFLSEHPDFQVAWIEKSFSAFPFCFLQHNLNLQNVLFAETKDALEWTVLQALKAQAFSVVVVYAETISTSALRRFQLASEKSQCALIWLTVAHPTLWTVSLQIQTQKTAMGLQPFVLRQRF